MQLLSFISGVILFGIIVFRWVKEADANVEKRRRAIEASTLHDADQTRIRSELVECISKAETCVCEVGRHRMDADLALKDAVREFSEGAFAPFWDAVERATNRLAESDASLHLIIQHSKNYGEKVNLLESVPPGFRVGLETLPDTSRTASLLRVIVRKAQKDFHFASIYEQRKTNKILIAGFRSLGDALSEMSGRLEASLNSLADALDNVAETSKENANELLSSVGKLREGIDKDTIARRDHEEELLEMLDNIQRGRQPRSVYPTTFR